MPEKVKIVKLNPIGAGFALVLLRLTAKVLVSSGLIEQLDKVVDKTSTDLDNLAVKVLKAALKVIAD